MYVKWTGSAWTTPTNIQGTGAYDYGWWNSIALDSSNTPHISYLDTANHYLMYATTTLPSDFFVVPEYVLGALLALGACFAAFVAFEVLKSRTNLLRLKLHG
jgi:hypothetical protein